MKRIRDVNLDERYTLKRPLKSLAYGRYTPAGTVIQISWLALPVGQDEVFRDNTLILGEAVRGFRIDDDSSYANFAPVRAILEAINPVENPVLRTLYALKD